MSILHDEAQTLIGTEARRVLEAHTRREVLLGLLEAGGAYDRGVWQAAIEQGWTAIAVPELYGGLGLGLIEEGIVAQAMGRAPAGVPFLTGGDGIIAALAASLHADLQARWLPGLASGQIIGAVTLTTGPAPLPGRPEVRFRDGVLSGTAQAVVGGAHADIALLWVVDEHGPALAFAELAGVRREAVASFDNSRGHAHLHFAETPGVLLAEGQDAFTLARTILARAAVLTAHEQLGGAEELLAIGRDYALTRKAFGQPIGAFQSVKHRLAELYVLIEIARANCIHAAARAGHSDFIRAAAAARLSATEAYDTAARDVVQIHGGIGVTWETGLHLHMRRARSLAIEQGNMLFWEDLLAKELTGTGA